MEGQTEITISECDNCGAKIKTEKVTISMSGFSIAESFRICDECAKVLLKKER